ncbi:MAG TPA: c-type cytochrome [Burkholderiaceae bacterium]|nr:c-type cytochrome [Burkholderiaceae bacterium]
MRTRFFIQLLARGALLLGSAQVAAAAAPFEDSMAQRTLACTACHGDQGRAGPDGYYPRIAGKPAGYLYNQLLNFREGRRHYALMTGLLDPLSNAYLKEVAEYFSALNLPYPAPLASTASSTSLQRGETLAMRGDASINVPACTQCHGEALTGVEPNVPGLLGLPRDYLNAQLGSWITGQRRAHAPDCMAQVTRKMTADDVTAVSSWLAGRPLPGNTRPVRALVATASGTNATRCGSAP